MNFFSIQDRVSDKEYAQLESQQADIRMNRRHGRRVENDTPTLPAGNDPGIHQRTSLRGTHTFTRRPNQGDGLGR